MAIFYSIHNVAEINSCIFYNENNSSKINWRTFSKKLSFELIQEQLEERAACATLPSNLRAKISKFLTLGLTTLLIKKENVEDARNAKGKIGKLNTIAQSASNFCA